MDSWIRHSKCILQDLKLFWNSAKPELTYCLRYYGLDLFPFLIFFVIFLTDIFINRSFSNKNRLVNYFKTYYLRSFFQIVLICSCIFELIQSFGIFYTPMFNDSELFQLVLLTAILRLCVYVILFRLDIEHYKKNLGTSSLSSLVVTIDWASKMYLLFEITYLHQTSYPIFELVMTIVRSICITQLLISYVFLPNLIVVQSDHASEADSLINSEVKINSSSHSLNEQKRSDQFSVYKKSLFCQIMFFYFEEFVLYGYRNGYSKVDKVMPLEAEFKVNNVLNDYELNYRDKYLKNSKMENYNILHLTLFLFKFFFTFNLFLFSIQIFLAQSDPQIIKWLITFVRVKEDIRWHGYLYMVILLVSTLTRVTIIGIFNRNMNNLQAKMQIILVNHIYRKALKRSTLKDDKSSDTYNLMTVDVFNIMNALYFSFDVIAIPLNTFLSIYFIYREIGLSIFYALGIFIIIGPMTYFITNKTKKYQKMTMKAKDSRLKFLSDLIDGIRTVKLNYFDEIFKQKVTEIREEEVKNFKKYQIYYGISTVIYYSLTIILSALSFFIYLSIDKENILTPERAFTTLNYFGLLKGAFIITPRALHLIVTSVVAAKRIQNFLRSDEKDDYVAREFDEENAVKIGKNVNFSWESNLKPTSEIVLKYLNLKIKKNSKVALVTKTSAAGRSSFLSCLLGEMKIVSNDKNYEQKVNISNDMRIAFVGNKPWIEMKSIKENILFGEPFNQQKYNYVLDRCLIRDELINYPKADEQVIDQDFNLELKQKICLARAYYSEANLILFEDFLNLFNDYSAKIVFDNIINPKKNGLFKDKTCIMVLNRMEYAKYFDQVLIFNNGEVRSEINFDKYEGKDDNLKSASQDADLQYKRSISSKLYNYENLDLPVEQTDTHDEKNCKVCSKKLINDDIETTHLSGPVYRLYFSTWNWIWLVLMIASYFLSMVFDVRAGNWLSDWSSNPENVTGDALIQYNKDGLTKYVFLSLFVSLFFTVANFSAIYGEVNSAIRFHKILLNKVLKLPLFFFARTPTGSIINRFSKDIDTIDHIVPFFLKMMVLVAFQILSVFWVIAFNFPMALIIIALMMIIYIFLFRIFLMTIIAAKRLELQTRTVLYKRFEELADGLQTILAFGKSKLFISTLNQNLEQNVRCNYMIYIAFKWLALRNEMIGISILITTSCFLIYNSETANGGQAALVLNFSIQLLALLMGLMGLVAEFFINFVSIERIYQYLELEEEQDSFKQLLPPENWPTNGKIKFINYSSTYTECRDAPLSNLDFEIEQNSLVAIVGKSGSGKSTLALSILNAIKSLKGRILIDDVDVTKISLESLRKNVSIFPQDVSLFSGIIRFNLDPENRYTDREIWTVLDYVGIKDQILYLQGNLNHEIDAKKCALSLGQRQLLCLARVFLKRSKLMIIDETDCQFDLDTEVRLRKLTEFNDRTILLITKNIGNIQAADKVLFLHDGQVQDFKAPDEIFGDRNNNGVLDLLNNNSAGILDLLNNNE